MKGTDRSTPSSADFSMAKPSTNVPLGVFSLANAANSFPQLTDTVRLAIPPAGTVTLPDPES